MKDSNHFTERGQALVLIAIGALVMFAFTALAIDGSAVFSDRRHAQNAADTSVLAAALSKTRGGNWQATGLDRASSNSYDNNATTNWVSFYSPPVDGPYAGDSEYVQVKITSIVKTRFANIFGISQMTNKVQAVARSVPSTTAPLFDGNAIVGLAPHDCKAVMYQGNANTDVIGSGIFVNSNCPDAAFFNHSSAASLTAPCLNSVGGITYDPGAINVPSNCINSGASAYNYPPDNFVFPNIICPSGTSQNGAYLNPGTYSGKFPPSGVTHLNGGTYCVNGDFRLNANDTLIGHDVIIIMQSGDVIFNGGADVELSGAPGPTTPDNPYGGLFLYMPMTNCGTININGNSSSRFVGTILAPCADISLEGTGGSGLQGQVIGYTVNISGTSDMSINYNSGQNWIPPKPPQVELAQ